MSKHQKAENIEDPVASVCHYVLSLVYCTKDYNHVIYMLENIVVNLNDKNNKKL